PGRSGAEAAAGAGRAAGALRDPGAQRRPARTPARAPEGEAQSAAGRPGGVAGRAARPRGEGRGVRQRSDRRAADAALHRARWRSVRGARGPGGARRLRSRRPPRRRAAGRGGAPRGGATGGAVRRGLPLRAAAATALLAAGGDRADAGRRAAVRGLRLPAPRVLPPATPRRHPARVPPPPPGGRRVRPSGAAGPDRVGGFHRAGGGGHRRRLRFRRLLHPGQLPAGQWPAGAAGGSRSARARRAGADAPAPGSEAAHPAHGNGRALPGDGVFPGRGLRRRVPGRRPGLAPVSGRGWLKPLRRGRFWLGLWLGGILGVVVVCLLPGTDVPPVLLSDKVERAQAFFALSAAAAQLFRRGWPLGVLALGLLALGAGIEVAQGTLTVSRSMESADFIADAIGV